ncbi:bifunctional MaoC family dehydratase N-terminal/OB-fold nucleic acid binding domain-containing protein [Streptomyces hiroshimensis]|uniref:DNA-binding protein n=1 Tax=Streptomyces hiroshimensis TaxID=66424 RepID=A0ABQ2YRF8_9ACTN|nr:bifunctional MaoC family dehydratase N-terminal/OB-fold nucleic acid binding domain-containing protein [Streptomyces hiroshimensis]GGX92907.1 DNA-binding protein [Streptomyces hiroshimensis]
MRSVDDVHHLLKPFEGRPVAVSAPARDPVNAPMIRHWCEAMGDTNPAYAGPDPIAPPTMLQAWTLPGLSGALSGRTPAGRGSVGHTSAHDELFALLDGAGYTAVVATDCEQEYVRPLRPGDEITFDSVIESVSPRKATRIGAGYFITTMMRVRVAGELVGTHRFRILKYAPVSGRLTEKPTEPPRPDRTARPARPRPVVNRDNAPFWEGVAAHKLLIQRCAACGALRFPWLPGCGRCGSPEWGTVEASGSGTVYSYVVMHHPPFPAFDPPYAVALVELAEGVRMISSITGVPHDGVRIGMSVELEFIRVDAGWELPVFRARSEGPEGEVA